MLVDNMDATLLKSRSNHMPDKDAASNGSSLLSPPPVDASEADDDSDCSSLTDSSGDTFHVFTDASVSVAPRSKSTSGRTAADELYGAERQLLQTERQKLETERLKLAEERKELERERRKLRAREEETEGVTASTAPMKLKKKKDREKSASARSTGDLSSELMSTERLQEKEERAKRRAVKRSDVKLNGMRSKSNDLLELRAVSAHEVSTSPRKPTRALSGDLDRHTSHLAVPYSNAKGPLGSLNKTSNHSLRNRIVGGDMNTPERVPEEESLDIVGEAKKADEAQRMKDKERRQQEEDIRRQTLDKARLKMQEERKQRQEMIRQRIAAEEAEAKLKLQKKKEEAAAAAAADAAKPVDNSDKARTQRAYSWYSKLAQPGRDAFKKKIVLMKNMDIIPEDIDLLPWNGMGTMVNVSKLNAILYQK